MSRSRSTGTAVALAALVAGLVWLAALPQRAAAEHPCDGDEPPEWCYFEPDEEPTPPPGVPPAAPTGTTAARAQDQALTVSWQDGSAEEDGHRIDLERPDGSWAEVVHANAGSGQALVPLPSAGRHCVRVRAVNPYGSSAPTVEACADTTPPQHRVSVLTLNLVGDDDAWDDGAGHEIPVPWRDRYDLSLIHI